jgi:hypothetical protein
MQAVRVEELKPQLERLGLEIDLYGDEQVIVRGLHDMPFQLITHLFFEVILVLHHLDLNHLKALE